MKITKILYHCATCDMGDTDEAAADGYREWIAAELGEEFPGTAIVVDDAQSIGGPEIETTDYADYYAAEEAVEQFLSSAWDRCNWEWLENSGGGP